jgi:hypothetical protein
MCSRIQAGCPAAEPSVDEDDPVAGSGAAIRVQVVGAQNGGKSPSVFPAATRPAAVERAGLHFNALGGQLPGEGGVIDVPAGVVQDVAGHHQAEAEARRLHQGS